MECGSSKMNTCNFSPAHRSLKQTRTKEERAFHFPNPCTSLGRSRRETKESRREVRGGPGLGPSWSGPMVRANPMANEGKNGMLAVKSPVS